jgi:hypothetical protein
MPSSIWLPFKHIVQRIYDGKFGIREVVIQEVPKGTPVLYKAQYQSRRTHDIYFITVDVEVSGL